MMHEEWTQAVQYAASTHLHKVAQAETAAVVILYANKCIEWARGHHDEVVRNSSNDQNLYDNENMLVDATRAY